MSIEVSTSDGYDINIWIKTADIPAFKELVFRATNLWPDAPPEIKRFSDLLLHGKVLQDYDSQNRDQTSRRYGHSHRCSCGYTSRISTNNPNPPTYPVMCHNEHVEVERVPIPESKGEFKIRTMPCKKLEMFNPAINEA